MINWITNDILTFLIALVLTGIIIPQILLIAFRKKLFDEIDERKIHKNIVPRLGGIAFFPSILFSVALVVGLNMKFGNEPLIATYDEVAMPVYFMVCAVLLMFLVGIADDLIGVRYRAKFLIQIIASILIVISGIYIQDLFGLFWIYGIPDWIGWIITGFLVVFVVNSINLIDGIDGLASGLSTVALVFYAIVFYASGEYVYSMIACASAGTLLPFFYYNVFGNANKQKKIFMGDTGALTTGMIMVFCTIKLLNMGDGIWLIDGNPMVIAVSPLIIPCFDVVRVYLHRVLRHRNPFLPDKCHIHHKLLALGLNQRAALCIIMAWSMIFIVINLLLSPYINATFLLGGDIIIWTILNIFLTRRIEFREKKYGQKIYD